MISLRRTGFLIFTTIMIYKPYERRKLLLKVVNKMHDGDNVLNTEDTSGFAQALFLQGSTDVELQEKTQRLTIEPSFLVTK